MGVVGGARLGQHREGGPDREQDRAPGRRRVGELHGALAGRGRGVQRRRPGQGDEAHRHLPRHSSALPANLAGHTDSTSSVAAIVPDVLVALEPPDPTQTSGTIDRGPIARILSKEYFRSMARNGGRRDDATQGTGQATSEAALAPAGEGDPAQPRPSYRRLSDPRE